MQTGSTKSTRPIESPEKSQPDRAGKVYLIGAGPGDIELLTLKAVRCLGQCDVLLLDDLVNRQILQFAKDGVHVIHVGKRGGKAHTPQDWILQTMISLAREGKVIGRVKGGDPFIFARGGEEIEALIKAKIACEIVSGLTSGVAVPAVLGIPLTHREHSSGITFITGHSCESGESSTNGQKENNGHVLQKHQLDWAALVASKTTIVVYMGMTRLPELIKKLTENKLPPSTPVAVIENGTLPQQRFIVSQIDRLIDDVEEARLGSPAIIVIGSVVAFAHQPLNVEQNDQLSISLSAPIQAKSTANQNLLVNISGDNLVGTLPAVTGD